MRVCGLVALHVARVAELELVLDELVDAGRLIVGEDEGCGGHLGISYAICLRTRYLDEFIYVW